MLSDIKKYLLENDISLFPFENIKLKSSKSTEEINSILNHKIANIGSLGVKLDYFMKYVGWLDKNLFSFQRILRKGRNSFIPIITGIINQKHDHSIIDLKFRLHKGVYTLLFIFLLFPLLKLGSSGYSYQKVDILEDYEDVEGLREVLGDEEFNDIFYANQENESRKWFPPNWYFLIMPYALVIIAYNYEARIVKRDLKKFLDAKIYYEDKW